MMRRFALGITLQLRPGTVTLAPRRTTSPLSITNAFPPMLDGTTRSGSACLVGGARSFSTFYQEKRSRASSRLLVSGLAAGGGGIILCSGLASCSEAHNKESQCALQFSSEAEAEMKAIVKSGDYYEFVRAGSYTKSFTVATLKDQLRYKLFLAKDAVTERSIMINKFGDKVEGPPGCVHGGCTATIFDVAQGVTTFTYKHRCATMKLEVTYKNFLPLGTEVKITTVIDDVSEVKHNGSRRAVVKSQMRSLDGKVLYAECKGLWYLFPEDATLETIRARAKEKTEKKKE